MFYGSQTIQQQRRLIEVGSQEGIITGEHGKGEIGKVGKNRSRKLPSICKHCGIKFFGIRGEKNQYCSHSCHNEFRVMKWLPCSMCMAKAGIGSNMAAKLLGITGGAIRRQWKQRGIKRDERAGIEAGKLRVKIERGCSPNEMAQREAFRQYEKACMEDIRSHSRFPDWNPLSRTLMHKIIEKRNGSYYSRMSPQKRAKHNSRWKNKCPIKRRKFLKQWKEKKRIIDPTYPIIESFRSRLSMIARGKTQRTKELIGCTTTEFRLHLERNMKRGMTWGNYGTHWHVDHILPVASFDHTDPNQIVQCWHWTNLRPLEAKKNLAKGCRITEPQMQLLLCAH